MRAAGSSSADVGKGVRARAHVATFDALLCGRFASRPSPSRPVNMMRIAESDAAVRLRPEDRVVDGLAMLAGVVGAYTIHVHGHAV